MASSIAVALASSWFDRAPRARPYETIMQQLSDHTVDVSGLHSTRDQLERSPVDPRCGIPPMRDRAYRARSYEQPEPDLTEGTVALGSVAGSLSGPTSAPANPEA